MKKLFAEFAGTFILVFLGTGAVIFDGMFGGAITHLGVGLVFGLAVMLIIYAIGDISGAHINPAVSIAFFLTGKAKFSDTWRFIIVQLLGAGAASFVLSLYAPAGSNLGATLPAAGLSVFKTHLYRVYRILFYAAQSTRHFPPSDWWVPGQKLHICTQIARSSFLPAPLPVNMRLAGAKLPFFGAMSSNR